MFEIHTKTFDLNDKNVFIVESGLQLIPKGHVEYMKVTDTEAVEDGKNVFCTLKWYEKVIEKSK